MNKKIFSLVFILGVLLSINVIYADEHSEITIPSIEIELADWYSPSDFRTSYHPTSDFSYYYSIPAKAFEGINYYDLGIHFYYRVLIHPDGTEEVIDSYKFDNHIPTRTEPNTDNCPGCGDYHYFAEYVIPEKTIYAGDLDEEGEYKVELRHIEISAPTNEMHPNADIDSVIDLYEGEEINYKTYNPWYDGMSSGEKIWQKCVSTSPDEYKETYTYGGLQEIFYEYKRWYYYSMGMMQWMQNRWESGPKYCKDVGKYEIPELGGNFDYSTEELRHTYYSEYRYVKSYIWIDKKTEEDVELSDLAESQILLEFEVEKNPMIPVILNADVFNPNLGNQDSPSYGHFSAFSGSGPGSGGSNPISPLGVAVASVVLVSSVGAGVYFSKNKLKIEPNIKSVDESYSPYYMGAWHCELFTEPETSLIDGYRVGKSFIGSIPLIGNAISVGITGGENANALNLGEKSGERAGLDFTIDSSLDVITPIPLLDIVAEDITKSKLQELGAYPVSDEELRQRLFTEAYFEKEKKNGMPLLLGTYTAGCYSPYYTEDKLREIAEERNYWYEDAYVKPPTVITTLESVENKLIVSDVKEKTNQMRETRASTSGGVWETVRQGTVAASLQRAQIARARDAALQNSSVTLSAPVVGVVKNITNAIGSVVGSIVNSIGNIVNGIANTVSSIARSVGTVIGGVAKAVTNAASSAINSVGNFIGGLFG